MGVLPARDHQSCLIIPGESEEWRGGLPGFQGRGRSNGARRPVPRGLGSGFDPNI
jgi:hypothetical protein